MDVSSPGKMDDSSDDSDICESAKNVQSKLVKSTTNQEELDDCAYKRRLGDLIFDANFEAGNLGHVENIDRHEYDLMVRPDVSNAKHRIWFNFRVSNQRQNQCVILTFVNISENLRLFHEGYCPVIRSRKRPNWMNLNEEQVFYYRSRHHGNRYVLSLVIRFSTQDDEHQLALFYPYSYYNLCDFLHRWLVELKRLKLKQAAQKRHRAGILNPTRHVMISSRSPEPPRRPANWRLFIDPRDDDELRTRSSLETSCDELPTANNTPLNHLNDVALKVDRINESFPFKPIHCVSINCNNNDSETLTRSSRSTVVIICRMDGGNLDSVASFVCHGLMDYLLSDCLIARAARECIEFTIFPMIDPDSIFSGNSCTDLLGRQSHERNLTVLTGSSSYSNLLEVQQKLSSVLDAGKTTNRTIILQLHVNLDLMGSRILGSHFSSSLRMERHLSVPKAMSKFIDGFYLETCRFSVPKNGCATDSSWLVQLTSEFSHADYYQFDVSPFGSFRRSLDTRDHLKYNQASYLAIGKAVVYSLVDVLRPRRADHVSTLLGSFQHNANDANEFSLDVAKVQ